MLGFLFVGLGGFLGSGFRYAITKWSARLNISLPLGTLLSNVIAGLLIGIVMGLERNAWALPERVKLFLTAGLLGGLSTFSTFSMETVDLFASGKYMLGVGNVALNLGLSLLGVACGLALAKVLAKAV